MKLLDLRKEIKNTFTEHEIDIEDADFIIAEVLGVKRTELVLIDEIEADKVLEIQEKVSLRLNNMPVEKYLTKLTFMGLNLLLMIMYCRQGQKVNFWLNKHLIL